MLSKPQCGNSEWLLPANTQDTDLRCSCAQLCRAPTPDTAATPLDPAISWTLPLHTVAFLSSETHKWEHPNPYPPNGMFGCHIIRGLFTKQPRLEDASRQAAHLCNNSPRGERQVKEEHAWCVQWCAARYSRSLLLFPTEQLRRSSWGLIALLKGTCFRVRGKTSMRAGSLLLISLLGFSLLTILKYFDLSFYTLASKCMWPDFSLFTK